MKCFHKDADCREDCALYQEGYKKCAFAILPILLAMCAKQLKELTEMIETLGYEVLQDRADTYCLGEDSHEWEEAQQR